MDGKSPVRHSAAEMLTRAREVLARIEGERDWPGKERFVRELRSRERILRKRYEAEQGQKGAEHAEP